MEAAALPTIVRAPSRRYEDVARICDAGAEGVMLPMVSTVEEAEEIVRSMKYTPRGRRGVVVRSAVDRYTTGPTVEKLAAANERTTLFAQIETADGVRNAEAIAAVDGVDCLWIGHFDLSCSLGVPGEFEHPDFLAAVDRVIAACQNTGKSLGRLVPDTGLGGRVQPSGVRFHRLVGRCLGARRRGGRGPRRDPRRAPVSGRLRRLDRAAGAGHPPGAETAAVSIRIEQGGRSDELRRGFRRGGADREPGSVPGARRSHGEGLQGTRRAETSSTAGETTCPTGR